MRNPAPLILLLLLAAAGTFLALQDHPAQAEPPPAAEATPPSEVVWPQDASDIPTDPKAVFGRLPNGFRYIILPNDEPPQRVSLRLHIATGSLMEAEDQRGIAHFLEHMVFNGTRHLSAEELIRRMQHLGIGFGAHVNAYTSFNETVYMLDLPDLDKDTLDLCFTVMRDFGDGALLEPEEIDKERGVILAEKTSRDSVDYRLMQQQFDSILPDSLIAKRFPIGDEEVIRTAPPERFVDYYKSYYTPDRMTFVVVGDVDPAAMEKRIAEQFGTMTSPEEKAADPDLGPVTQPEGLQPLVFSDKEVPETQLGLLVVNPFTRKPDTRAERISKMPLAIAHSILGRRFDRLAKKDGSPILGGSAARFDLFNHVDMGSIDVEVADERWKDAVAVLEQEFRRALEFGFTAAELAEAKANLLNAYEQAVKSKDTRPSDQLASGTARSISDQEVLTAPETDLEIVKEGLESVTPESCHEAFSSFWKDQGMYLVLTDKTEPLDAIETLGRLYEESRAVPVDPQEEKELGTFTYELGEPGTVESREEIADLGITRAVLSNGVTVNLKPTDFERNSIRMIARIGHGKLAQPEDKVGLSGFATAVIEGGGIGDYSADDLQRLFAGRNVAFGFSAGEECFSLSGRTTPDDLELQLHAMAAQIVAPGYREEAVEQYRKQLPAVFQQLRHTSAGPIQDTLAWLHGNDPRYQTPDSPEPLLAYTTEDVRSWLDVSFVPAPIELSVVGDFEPEATLQMIARTFGALPPRPRTEELPANLRKVTFPTAPQTEQYGFESKIPQGEAIVVWQVPGPRRQPRQFRRFQMLSEILGDRLREEIREKLGASYSPAAWADGSRALLNFGYLIARATSKPDDAELLTQITVDLAQRLATEGATEDELDRARKPVLADIDKSLRDNDYWLRTVLDGSRDDPGRLDLARDRRSDVASIRLEEINALAASHLSSNSALRVIIRSEAPAGEESETPE